MQQCHFIEKAAQFNYGPKLKLLLTSEMRGGTHNNAKSDNGHQYYFRTCNIRFTINRVMSFNREFPNKETGARAT